MLFDVKIDFGGPGIEYEQICAFADSGSGVGGGGGGGHISENSNIFSFNVVPWPEYCKYDRFYKGISMW